MKFEVKVEIEDLNYAEAIRAMLPYIKKEYIPLPEAVLNIAEKPGVLENFLKFVPQSAQDELMLKVFEKNREKIINRAQRMADNNNIGVKVCDVSLNEVKDVVVN